MHFFNSDFLSLNFCPSFHRRNHNNHVKFVVSVKNVQLSNANVCMALWKSIDSNWVFLHFLRKRMDIHMNDLPKI